MHGKSRSKKRAKVLVVDDEAVVLDLFKKILTIDNHEAVVVRNPLEALELIKSSEFDIIISDFRMPRMSGEEFYDRAKEIKPGIEKKFVFTTGEMDPVRKRKFIRKTGAAVISKPFRVEEVRAFIKSVLETKKSS